ncbi:GPW/gp25 family protein [Nitriliruptor alkaliphilus]|uniref:GPW/gp25 family protein n=1 Tax=Nitriliruptor alkaliphilus TaxID=427918 RepID=UPI00069831B2|nr:GPW/gp25 family protein [Nitriliruptor alkaliphilus]
MVYSPPFIGRGLAFPLRTSATGAIALVEDQVELEEAIRLIVSTAPGERPMRPEFGCRIHDYVFAPISDTTIGSIIFAVEQALERWEPRVDVAQVQVYADDDTDGLLYIDVGYRVKATNDERNLVFPFYTIPEHED